MLDSPADPHDRQRASVASGMDRFVQEFRDACDRFVASDPGWARLRQGTRAIVAVGTTLLVIFGLAQLLGEPALMGMLLGALVAMLMSTGINDGHRRAIARTASVAPFAAAAGASLGVITATPHPVGLVTFVLVSYVAVWVRRFGPRWVTLGFLFWQGFFLALLLHPAVSSLPFLLVATAVSGIWVGALLLSVLYEDPQRRLLRIVTALRARGRSSIAAALTVLDEPAKPRAIRQLRSQLNQLSEIALLLDGQLADRRALPDGVPPGRMRRWTIDFEIGMDEVASATVDIATQIPHVPPATLVIGRQVLTALGWADAASAVSAARKIDLTDDSNVPGVRRLASAALFLLETVRRWDSGEVRTRPKPGAVSLDEGQGFEPVVNLISGRLPGSAMLAQLSLGPVETHRWSPSRMRLTTRHAIQVAVASGLAIIAGEAISTAHFSWAVIAVFVAFLGTSTSGETVRKGGSRIVGTVLGLIGAAGLADLVDGHLGVAIAAILVCIFLAFFFQQFSYGLMVFFLTVMFGQLYTLLGTYSDELLLIRLAETAAGAAIAIVVALLVLPTHSRATLRVARRAFLGSLGDLLDECAVTLEGAVPARDLLMLTVLLQAASRQLVQTRRALTKGRLFGTDRVALRHRITVLGSCAASARTIAASISPSRPDALLSKASRELAVEARRLGDLPHLSQGAQSPAGTVMTVQRVRALLEQVPTDDRIALHALRRLNEALALLGPGPLPPLSA